MDKQQAFYNLWSSFNIPAYDENTVPDDASFPRIDYQVILDDIDVPVFPMAKLWYRGSSWTDADYKLAEIAAYIDDLQPIKLDEGYMYVCKGEPFAQRMSEENDKTIKGYLINLKIEFFTKK